MLWAVHSSRRPQITKPLNLWPAVKRVINTSGAIGQTDAHTRTNTHTHELSLSLFRDITRVMMQSPSTPLPHTTACRRRRRLIVVFSFHCCSEWCAGEGGRGRPPLLSCSRAAHYGTSKAFRLAAVTRRTARVSVMLNIRLPLPTTHDIY